MRFNDPVWSCSKPSYAFNARCFGDKLTFGSKGCDLLAISCSADDWSQSQSGCLGDKRFGAGAAISLASQSWLVSGTKEQWQIMIHCAIWLIIRSWLVAGMKEHKDKDNFFYTKLFLKRAARFCKILDLFDLISLLHLTPAYALCKRENASIVHILSKSLVYFSVWLLPSLGAYCSVSVPSWEMESLFCFLTYEEKSQEGDLGVKRCQTRLFGQRPRRELEGRKSCRIQGESAYPYVLSWTISLGLEGLSALFKGGSRLP